MQCVLQKGPEINTDYTTTVHRDAKPLFQGTVTFSNGKQRAEHPEEKREATGTPLGR